MKNILATTATTATTTRSVATIVTVIMMLLFATTVQKVEATTLTYYLRSSEKACFYAFAARPNQKISFYFAVQTGGDFDIDYTITGPANSLINSGVKERQGDYVFAATATGEYSFCFTNGVASYADKYIDFDISVQDDEFSLRAELPMEDKVDKINQHLTPLENSIYSIGASLSNIQRLQRHFRTRENRNFATVKSTVDRIFHFSMLESIMILSVAFLQVYVIRALFKGNTKGRV